MKPEGVSYAEYSYALKAHLDVLVMDAFSHPLFAVEFDGPYHETDPQQQQRDRLKNALLERFGLPLLRINARYLNRKFRGFDLLSYFLELWFFWPSYLKELVPFDPALHSDFDALWDDPDFALEHAAECRPYRLSQEIEGRILDLCKTGQIASRSRSYWIGQDDDARYRCIMWVLLPGGRCCFVETAMRHQLFPVGLCSILAQITAFNLFEQIQSVLGGERAARTSVKLKERLDYASHFAFRLSCAANHWD